MQGFIAHFMVFNVVFFLPSQLLQPSDDVRVSALAPLVKNVIFGREKLEVVVLQGSKSRRE